MAQCRCICFGEEYFRVVECVCEERLPHGYIVRGPFCQVDRGSRIAGSTRVLVEASRIRQHRGDYICRSCRMSAETHEQQNRNTLSRL